MNPLIPLRYPQADPKVINLAGHLFAMERYGQSIWLDPPPLYIQLALALRHHEFAATATRLVEELRS